MMFGKLLAAARAGLQDVLKDELRRLSEEDLVGAREAGTGDSQRRSGSPANPAALRRDRNLEAGSMDLTRTFPTGTAVRVSSARPRLPCAPV